MTSKIINLSLPPELVKIIDEQAKREYCTRSDYIKRAVIDKLKQNNALDPESQRKKTHQEIQREEFLEFTKSYFENTPIEEIEDLA